MGVVTNDGGGGGGGGSSIARRWFLTALPGSQDTPRTANPPFDWKKTLSMRCEICAHRVAMGGSVLRRILSLNKRIVRFMLPTGWSFEIKCIECKTRFKTSCRIR